MNIDNNKYIIHNDLTNTITYLEKAQWQKIYLRLLMIRKQIYSSAKKNNLFYVHKLQKYIIKCNEAKILSISKTFDNIYYCYNSSMIIKPLIRSINAIDLLKLFSLNILKCYKNYSLVINEIKQNLLYISLEPICKAKTIKKSETSHCEYLFSNYSAKNCLNKNILKKLFCYNYINKSISKWLHDNVLLSLSKSYQVMYLNSLTKPHVKTSKDLFELLSQIISNDLNWYIFNYLKINIYHCKCLNKILQSRKKHFDITDKLTEIFDFSLHKLLYRKTYKNFKIINSFYTNKELMKKFIHLYLYYYHEVTTFFKIKLSQNCNKLTNSFFNIWFKKKFKNKQSMYKHNIYFKQLNQILNNLVFLYNISNYYITNQ
uniref:Reverse transcriptase N-terminal domain-containing protein n=1 Tax=Dipterosiphonia australica TaxID=2007208 RepID=A0A1Z1MLT0_9FLOR|nr:hypothetical protein [Dipterosiphonia australica]ARW66812.1 hypothetical protein [Dipterosiphonia australica]